jgi:hypothetical protein
VQDKQGSVTLSFTACRDMLPDPAFYADCLQASYDELHAAAMALAAPKTAAKKRSKRTARPKKKVKR